MHATTAFANAKAFLFYAVIAAAKFRTTLLDSVTCRAAIETHYYEHTAPFIRLPR